MRQRISDVVDRDYTQVIKRKMDAVFAGQGTVDRERDRSKEQRSAFIVSRCCPVSVSEVQDCAS
jgi:hypothetical protein